MRLTGGITPASILVYSIDKEMNIRIHWVIGTSILVAIAVTPVWLWWTGEYQSAWILLTPLAVLVLWASGYLLYQRIRDKLGRSEANYLSDSSGPTQEIPEEVYCPQCAYDLRGAQGVRCSECGYRLAGLKAIESRIPWVHRQERGRWGAYWATVWFVTVRHRRFCEEYARAVSYPDARSFQRTTVILIGTPVLIALAITYLSIWYYIYRGWASDEFVNLKLYLEIWPILPLFVSYILLLVVMTGVPSYFFHPKHLPIQRQNTAVAMSYYAGAPLVFSFVPTILWIALSGHGNQCWHGVLLAVLAAITTLAVLFLAWLVQVRLVIRLMPHSIVRHRLMILGLPVLWMIAGLLTLVVLPLVVFYVIVIIASLG